MEAIKSIGQRARVLAERVTFNKRPIKLIEHTENLSSCNKQRLEWLKLFGEEIVGWINHDFVEFYFSFFQKPTKPDTITYGIYLLPTNLIGTNSQFADRISILVDDLDDSKSSHVLTELRNSAKVWGKEKEFSEFLPEFKQDLQNASNKLRGKSK